ncbi:hypothetical protein BKH41_04055 [Helicobacter sp. 12S02232-10]|nr:hypothetical protein BKH41_04055 [Helicobacter sp. 12S02232-10]
MVAILGRRYEWLEEKNFSQWFANLKKNEGKSKKHGAFVNIGIFKIFLNHNRFELGAKIRIYKIWDFEKLTKTIYENRVFANPVDFYSSYSYSF